MLRSVEGRLSPLNALMLPFLLYQPPTSQYPGVCRSNTFKILDRKVLLLLQLCLFRFGLRAIHSTQGREHKKLGSAEILHILSIHHARNLELQTLCMLFYVLND